MGKVETVLIEHEGFPDGMLVNKADFDAGGHVLFGQAPAIVLTPLDEMTVKELRAFAGEHGITLGAEATTKDAILAAIKAADWQLNSAEAKE